MKTKHINRLLAVMAGALSLQTVVLWPLNVVGQGAQMSFNNRIPGVVVAPVYGWEPSNPGDCKTGNPPAGYPAGTQSYGGNLLPGNGYTAELWIGPAGSPEETLTALAPQTTFRTGSDNEGYVVPVTITLPPFATPGTPVLLQMRVWDNMGGTASTWAQAQSNPSVPRGSSLAWSVTAPSGTPPPATSPMAGLRSFNLCLPPQPPTIVTQPVSQVVSPGAPVSFSVVATGDETLHYQWKFKGTPIQDATGTAYSIAHAGPEHVGTYIVSVTNDVESKDSQPASLSLLGLHVCAVITLDGPVGTEYRIEYSPEMAEPPVWSSLETVTLAATPFHYIDWGSPGAARRYYRIVQLLP